MTQIFTKITPGLQLTDQDLLAFGAVMAQWALAEHTIRSHVYTLTFLAKQTDHKLESGFNRLQIQWKKLLNIACNDTKEYLDIGIKLAGAAKNLNSHRNAVAHWPASKSGTPDAPTKFVEVKFDSSQIKEERTYSTDELLKLAGYIHQLFGDVAFFGHALMCDVFPSLVTYHGPKHEGRFLDIRSLPSTQIRSNVL